MQYSRERKEIDERRNGKRDADLRSLFPYAFAIFVCTDFVHKNSIINYKNII